MCSSDLNVPNATRIGVRMGTRKQKASMEAIRIPRSGVLITALQLSGHCKAPFRQPAYIDPEGEQRPRQGVGGAIGLVAGFYLLYVTYFKPR